MFGRAVKLSSQVDPPIHSGFIPGSVHRCTLWSFFLLCRAFVGVLVVCLCV